MTATVDEFIHQYPGESHPVVLLHGLLTSAKYWNPARRRLTAAGYRVATVDLLGFGRAARVPAASYDYNEHVEHVKNALLSISGGQPVVLVGHSLGGLIALKLARKYPSLVSELVMFNAPLFRDSHEAKASIEQTNKLYKFLMTSRFRSVGWGAAHLLGFHVWGRHSTRAREGALRRVIFRGKGIHHLEQITVPTTIITGAADRAEYLNNLQQASLPPNVRVIVAPTGHHLPAQAPHYVTWTMDLLSGGLRPEHTVPAV